jgi:RNA polymerase sigma-70 factor (ECF subfamily)
MTDIDDDDLVRMYRDGDADAFDALFDRHHATAYRFARAILGDGDGAREVLQESFLAVARTARTYTPRARFRAWLLRIVRNRALNLLAAEKRRREVVAAHGSDGAVAAPSPVERAIAGERRERVRAAMAALPEGQRQALALFAFERLKYREIAEVLEVPINTVKTLIRRARGALGKALEDEDG